MAEAKEAAATAAAMEVAEMVAVMEAEETAVVKVAEVTAGVMVEAEMVEARVEAVMEAEEKEGVRAGVETAAATAAAVMVVVMADTCTSVLPYAPCGRRTRRQLAVYAHTAGRHRFPRSRRSRCLESSWPECCRCPSASRGRRLGKRRCWLARRH